MTKLTHHLSDMELGQLRKLLGGKIAWVHGSRFLIADHVVMSPYLSIDRGDEFMLIRSERHETPVEGLDHWGFTIVSSSRVDGDRLECPVLLETVSSFAISNPSAVVEISVLCTRFEGDTETVEYDSWIVLELEDGRELSIGHAPAVYAGVCIRWGGSPAPDLGDRLEARISLREESGHAT